MNEKGIEQNDMEVAKIILEATQIFCHKMILKATQYFLSHKI